MLTESDFIQSGIFIHLSLLHFQGIGLHNDKELLRISSKPSSTHVFYAEDFDDLSKLKIISRYAIT